MKFLLSILILLGCYTSTFSQNKLNFCASVDENGYCFLNNKKFFLPINNDSLPLFMQIITDKNFGTDTKITYKIYSVDKSGVEKLVDTAEQNVKAAWVYAWLPHLFIGAGKYSVKAYDADNKLLCSRELELFSGK